MRKMGLSALLTLLVFIVTTQSIFAQESDTSVVQAILFYRLTCPHCHDVIENHLPRIKEEYGDQLQLIGIDTTNQAGSKLYEDAVNALDIPQDRRGVPTLIIGDVILVGGQEIPERLPTLIDEGLAKGGIGWPAIPELKEAIPDLPPSAGLQNTNTTSLEGSDTDDQLLTETMSDELASPSKDPVGFALGWIVMAVMVFALIFAVIRIWRISLKDLLNPAAAESLRSWTIPILSLVGLGISSYLAFVEISQVDAACGPVGECNIVQSSQYAQIFGIPIAVLGFLFYLTIMVLWLILRLLQANWIKWIPTLILVATTLGTLFSIYLTLLELFVIKAICAWCLSSAIVTTILFLIIVTKLTKSEDREMTAQEVASQAG